MLCDDLEINHNNTDNVECIAGMQKSESRNDFEILDLHGSKLQSSKFGKSGEMPKMQILCIAEIITQTSNLQSTIILMKTIVMRIL